MYKFYTTSESAWDAMLEDIKKAKQSIYLEMYIFIDNTPDHNFFEILKQKANESVRVKIIIDSFGSSELSKKTIDELRESGAEVLFFSYWFERIHKKILIIDEKIVFLGGVNIHKFFRKWNDLQIRLEGNIVKYALRSFGRIYNLCGGKDVAISAYEKSTILGKAKLFFLEHQPRIGRLAFKNLYKKKINGAKKNIVIVTTYLFPSRWFVARLHQAVLRGVDVKMILPKKTDSWISDRANYFYIYKLSRLGIKFYLQKEMNHAKAMIIDDNEGLIGSQNIDLFSLNYNLEAGVFFNDKNMVEELKKIIEKWRVDSKIFDFQTYGRKWFDYIFAGIFKFLKFIASPFWSVL